MCVCCRIVTTLSGKVGFQIQYQLTFCLWVMTFDPTVADKVSRCVCSLYRMQCTLLFTAVVRLLCYCLMSSVRLFSYYLY